MDLKITTGSFFVTFTNKTILRANTYKKIYIFS